MARMLPGEAENGVGMNRSVREGKKVYSALSGPTDWILRYIKTTFTFTCTRRQRAVQILKNR